jgi:hypothetical protein
MADRRIEIDVMAVAGPAGSRHVDLDKSAGPTRPSCHA